MRCGWPYKRNCKGGPSGVSEATSSATGCDANHSGRVYTGVTIQGIDVGGMTPDEVAVALRDAASDGNALWRTR